jgi:hypothetical protein
MQWKIASADKKRGVKTGLMVDGSPGWSANESELRMQENSTLKRQELGWLNRFVEIND